MASLEILTPAGVEADLLFQVNAAACRIADVVERGLKDRDVTGYQRRHRALP